MPCAICNHTVQAIGAQGIGRQATRVFWCPRCGSIKTEMGDHSETKASALVGRVRAVAGTAKECTLDGEPAFAIARHHWLTLCESIAIGEDVSGRAE